jgi:hypothetical protein
VKYFADFAFPIRLTLIWIKPSQLGCATATQAADFKSTLPPRIMSAHCRMLIVNG